MDLKFGSPKVVVDGEDLQSFQQALLKLDSNTVTHIGFQLYNISRNELPAFYTTIHQTLSSFKCLNAISISDGVGLPTTSQVKVILTAIARLDNIVFLSLFGISWECFCDMPEVWKGLFSKLLSLQVRFGDDYQNYSDNSESGLKKVLTWVAQSVELLVCNAHWNLYWDKLSHDINFPRLRRLELGEIAITESYLRTWLACHIQVTSIDLHTNIKPSGENKHMTAADVVLMFSEPMFHHIIQGLVRPEDDSEDDWAGTEVLIYANWVVESDPITHALL